MDERAVDKPVVGAILLATDLTTEHDIRTLMPDAARTCVTRIPFDNPTTSENLVRTLPHIQAAAGLIVPGVRLSALYFSCTSATVTLGEDRIAQAIQAARPGVPVVTPIGAAKLAFRTLGVSRIAVMMPYIEATALPIIKHFEEAGFAITQWHAMGMENDQDMACLEPDAILEAASRCVTQEAEALFISCTALPAAGQVPMLERAFGIPVVTSNLAGLWLAQRLVGITASPDGHGHLMTLQPEMVAA